MQKTNETLQQKIENNAFLLGNLLVNTVREQFYYANSPRYDDPKKVESILNMVSDYGIKNEFYDFLAKTFNKSLVNSPIVLLCNFGFVNTLSVLLNFDSRIILLKDNYGNILLHSAIEHPAVVNKLLESGSDITAKNLNGDTPLHKAIKHNYLESAKILLEKDPHIALIHNNDGDTPIDIAQKSGNALLINMFEISSDQQSHNLHENNLNQNNSLSDDTNKELVIAGSTEEQ